MWLTCPHIDQDVHMHTGKVQYFLINTCPCCCWKLAEFWILRGCQNSLLCTAPRVLWSFVNWSAALIFIIVFYWTLFPDSKFSFSDNIWASSSLLPGGALQTQEYSPLYWRLDHPTPLPHWVLTKTSVSSTPLFHNSHSKNLFFLKISRQASIQVYT